MTLIRSIGVQDDAALRLLSTSPNLAKEQLEAGATRQEATAYFLKEIRHYVYQGDTALHIAAAALRPTIVRELLAQGADVHAKNRRGAEPLHYAVDQGPGARLWNPAAQAETIACLIAAGADPNAADRSGVTPLHRAVRNLCAAAVQALLAGGADVQRKSKRGSTAFTLATRNTGRSGSGSVEARAQREEILRILEQRGARHSVE